MVAMSVCNDDPLVNSFWGVDERSQRSLQGECGSLCVALARQLARRKNGHSCIKIYLEAG